VAYIDWWNRTGPVTLGERFGLNEISIARNTLSPTKSYTEGGRIGLKGGTYKGIPYTDAEAEAIYGKHIEKLYKNKKISKAGWSKLNAVEKDAVYDAWKYDIANPDAKLRVKALEQQKWISDNASKYSSPKLMEDAFKKHFKFKNIADADIFKDSMTFTARKNLGTITLTNAPNIKGFELESGKNIFNFTKGSTESNLFRIAVLQNNKEAAKELAKAFKTVHDKFGKIRTQIHSEKISFEKAMELLGKNKILNEFNLIFRSPGVMGGVGKGSLRETLLALKIPAEHLESYALARRPFLKINEIMQTLSRSGGAEEWGLTTAEASETIEGWNKIKKGYTGAGQWIDDLEKIIGKSKFRNLFGTVVFEHQLAKRFGKNWEFLPRDYLIRGQMGNEAFNTMKLNVFDKPMMKKISAYKKAVTAKDTAEMLKLEGEIKNLHKA